MTPEETHPSAPANDVSVQVTAPRARRIHWLWLPALPLLLPILIALLLLGTEAGLKLALYYGLREAPLVTVAEVDGSLLNGFTLQGLRYVTDDEELEAESISLELSPTCFLRKRLCVETLALRNIDWRILKHRESPPFEFPAISLPPLAIPVAIDIADASLNRLSIHSKNSDNQDRQFDIRDAHIRLHTDGDTLFIDDIHTDLVFSALTIRAGLEGSLDVRGETAANLTAKVGLDFAADVPDLNIEGDIHGSAFAPTLSVATHGLVEAQGEIQASFREKGWPVYARVKQNAPIQLAETVPVTLSRTAAIISGHVNAYHVEGTTEVSGIPKTPVITAGIITDGGFFGLSKGAVDLRIGNQQANVKGEFTWYPRLYWNTQVDFSHLDAATWLEGATSDLSGSAQVDGEWYLDVPFRNTVNSLQTRGQWRDRPLALNTTFTSTADTFDVKQLDASLGRNQINAKGLVNHHWDLNGQFDLRALSEVLPQLDGAARGKVALQGPRDNPAIDITAASSLLRINTTQLESVTANINGTLAQHTATGSAQWQGYLARATLVGGIEKSRWQGLIRSLDISREQKQYSLTSPAPARYGLETQALKVDKACLHTPTESACVDTQWNFTSGIGALSGRVNDFAPGFIMPLITIAQGDPGTWTGDIGASFKQNRLIGANWQMRIQDLTLRRVQDKVFKPSILADNVQLKGQLKQGRLVTESTVRWPDQQQTTLAVTFPDIRKPDTLELALDSAPLPVHWAAPWIDAFHLQGGTIAGQLRGSITAGWPTLTGHLQVQDGQLSTPKKSWGLEQLALQLAVNGTTATLTGTTLDDRGLPWQIETPFVASWSAPDRTLRLQQGCLGTSKSTLCVRGHQALENGKAREQGLLLEADAKGNISPWLAPLLTDNALIDGPFEGSARLSSANGKLSGKIQMRSRISTTVAPEDGSAPPQADVTLNAQLDNDVLLTTLSIQGNEQSSIEGVMTTNLGGQRNIDGHIEVSKVQVAPLRPLIREVDKLAGELNGTFLISGTLGTPELEGELRLSEGKLSSADYPISFTLVTAEARFTQQNAHLVANLESGQRGRAILTSNAYWSDGVLKTESRLTGQQLPLKQGSDINLRLDTDLTLNSTDGRVDLGGLIHVKEGFLRVAKLPENSVDVSKDVIFVDERGFQETEKGVEAHVNLVVQLSDLVQLDGLGAQVRMNGAVGIQQTPPLDPTGRGSLTITEGTYTGYGQKLKITKGQILFNGPLDSPVLAIKAVREITSASGSTVTAGINISGTPQLPESSLFSVPAMPEDDILSYIVLGRPRDESGSSSNFAMNQALLSVGLYGSEDVTRDLASKVGIDDFEISTSTDKDKNDSVNVGGYLSPRLFLQYGVGIKTPVRTITLRYRLTESIFLEAMSGLESALDVLYSFEVE